MVAGGCRDPAGLAGREAPAQRGLSEGPECVEGDDGGWCGRWSGLGSQVVARFLPTHPVDERDAHVFKSPPTLSIFEHSRIGPAPVAHLSKSIHQGAGVEKHERKPHTSILHRPQIYVRPRSTATQSDALK